MAVTYPLDAVRKAVRGAKVGLFSNDAFWLEEAGDDLIGVVRRACREMVVLYAEHGPLSCGSGGEPGRERYDPALGCEVRSISTFENQPQDLGTDRLDLLMVGMPDIGCRHYTYKSTMCHVMQEGACLGLPVIVVDFPNPVRGDVVDGSVDDQTYWGRQTIFKSSPYFLAPLALRHGMTMGELALYAKAYLKLDLDLRVIRLEGWRREMWWDETGRPYLPMEPTDCTPQTPVFFLCTGLFQSTNLSWGIGTCEPFAVLGAPWMEPDRLLQAMRGRGLPGLTWSRAHFIPRWIGEQGCWARHAGRVCHGVRLHVTDRDALRVARTQLSLFVEMFRLFPGKFHYADNDAEQKQSDGMARRSGHEQWGRRLENGEGVETLLHEWERAAGQFAELRRPYLLY